MQSPSHTHATPTRPQTPGQTSALQVKTHIKAGGLSQNHNETLVRTPRPAAALRVKTHIKAGEVQTTLSQNHNETLVRSTPRKHSRA